MSLLILNTLIIIKLTQQFSQKSELTGTKNDSDGESKNSVTAMLLAVSFAHLICVAPLQIMYLVDKSDPFGWKITEKWQAWVALRWSIAINVKYANHAVNFILYCISGKKFRESLFNMLRKWGCKCRKKKNNGQLSSTSTKSISVATISESV